MAKHNETGLKGEKIALEFLTGKGYQILHCNWRNGHKELDVVARQGDILVVIEIKTRSGLGFGFPEEAVTHVKQGHLRAAARKYLEEFPHFKEVRFDVISIILNGDAVEELLHLEDAF